MAAGHYSFTIEQGATFSRTVTWYSDVAQTFPVDLTGYSARMKVKTADLVTTILDSAAGDITLTLGGALGTIGIAIAAAKTATLVATVGPKLVYDLELVSGATVTRLLQGGITVSAEVTT